MVIEDRDLHKSFTKDENAMLLFLAICQPSLDPESYETVIEICKKLCKVRHYLSEESLEKCLRYMGPERAELSGS